MHEEIRQITQAKCHIPVVHRRALVHHGTVWDQTRTWDHWVAARVRRRTARDVADVHLWLQTSTPASYSARSASLPLSPSAPSSPSVNIAPIYYIWNWLTDKVSASAWNKVRTICIWSRWWHCHPIISCFIKIQTGLPFWHSKKRLCLNKCLLSESGSMILQDCCIV